jgi:hypothetical protein
MRSSRNFNKGISVADLSLLGLLIVVLSIIIIC